MSDFYTCACGLIYPAHRAWLAHRRRSARPADHKVTLRERVTARGWRVIYPAS